MTKATDESELRIRQVLRQEVDVGAKSEAGVGVPKEPLDLYRVPALRKSIVAVAAARLHPQTPELASHALAETNAPALASLRRPHAAAVVLAVNGEPAIPEVEIAPADLNRLADPHAPLGEEAEEEAPAGRDFLE